MGAESLGLGKTMKTKPKVDRECTHMAVCAMEAGERLYRGDKLTFANDHSNDTVVKVKKDNDVVVGVVDPFLEGDGYVPKGKWFWVYLQPGSITELTHTWEHPLFKARRMFGAQEAEDYIRAEAVKLDNTGYGVWDYDRLMRAAHAYVDYGSEIEDNGELQIEDPPTFWKHFQKLTGKKPDNMHTDFFTCC